MLNIISSIFMGMEGYGWSEYVQDGLQICNLVKCVSFDAIHWNRKFSKKFRSSRFSKNSWFFSFFFPDLYCCHLRLTSDAIIVMFKKQLNKTHIPFAWNSKCILGIFHYDCVLNWSFIPREVLHSGLLLLSFSSSHLTGLSVTFTDLVLCIIRNLQWLFFFFFFFQSIWS